MNKKIKNLEAFITQCEEAFQWSKTAKLVTHHGKLVCLSVTAITTACVAGFLWLSCVQYPETSLLAKIFGTFMLSFGGWMFAVPATSLAFLLGAKWWGKGEHYGVWINCMREKGHNLGNDLKEVQKQRRAFVNMLKDHNVEGSSELVQRLKDLEEEADLTAFFWEECQKILGAELQVTEVDLQQEWGDFVEVVTSQPLHHPANKKLKL